MNSRIRHHFCIFFLNPDYVTALSQATLRSKNAMNQLTSYHRHTGIFPAGAVNYFQAKIFSQVAQIFTEQSSTIERHSIY